MNFDEKLFKKIDDYLKGRLTSKGNFDFEKEIEANPALAVLVDKQRVEEEGMEYLVEKDLIQKMKDWETNPPTNIIKKNNGNSNWKYGLGILLLLSTALILYLNRPINPPENKPLNSIEESMIQPESQNYPDSNVIELKPQETEPPEKESRQIANIDSKNKKPITTDTPKSENPLSNNKYLALAEMTYSISLPENLKSDLRSINEETSKNFLTSGIQAFAEGNIKLAISEFNKINQRQNPVEYAQAQDYLAHAYFKTKQFNKAADIFKNIANNAKGNTTIDRAEWYWLLSLIPNYVPNKVEADRLLQKMTNPDNYHNYDDKAKQLKNTLEQVDN